MFFNAIFFATNLSLTPYVIKVILDRLSDHSIKNVYTYIGGPILIYFSLNIFMTTLFRCYDYFVQIKMIPQLRKKITNSIFGYMLQHDHDYYQNNFSGSLTNKINDLTNSIPEIIQISIDRFFCHILGVIIAIYTLWFVRIEFAVVMILWIILFCWVSFFCSRKIQNLADNWSELGSSITGKIVDSLSNSLSIKLFSRQLEEKKILNQTLEEAVKAEQKLQLYYFWMWIFYGYSFVLTQGICLYFLLIRRMQGLVSLGDFALVISLNLVIVDFLWMLASDFSQFSKLLGKIKQALRTTTAPLDTQDKPDAPDLVVTKGKIVFENVRFFYKNAEPWFENKSIVIFAGQKVGLVGYSGGGKSTFVNLILRLFDVTNGRILIDDQDISEVTQKSLREAISMIPQDPSLFHRTIMENIRYGRPDASDDEIKKAAQAACAHEFISQLSLGYDTLIGERGIKLSGGQRQRIAISRAILKNARILILDEATSQIDSINEKEIQESLWFLMQDKTTIVIAHRLSTLLNMDRILVFDQGKIVQDGTHNELIKKGLYKSLWDAQVTQTTNPL
jgi:ATP-binding cassette subfamily B protein